MSGDNTVISLELGGFDPVGETPADHDRRIAINDLLDANTFAPEGLDAGPYAVKLAIEEGRLLIEIRSQDGELLKTHLFSMGPFRGVYKDYFMICDSYNDAVRDASLSQVEAIDMGRRGIHNEGSELLRERLDGKIDVDYETARRLFTLIGSLHRRAIGV